MTEKRISFQKLNKAAAYLFPLLLLLYPLLKVNQGVDLTDTPYSLGNYRFFENAQGVWILATFLANVTGFLLTKLPLAQTMLGMKFYTSLLISLMALLGYRFYRTKMPAAIAFIGEFAAIGFCWCPTGILYNYLTYLLFLSCGICLFRGLAGKRNGCLFLAGVLLGLNVSVRTPNLLEAALIFCVWYYGVRKKKSFEELIRETLLCLIGFLAAQAVMFLIISLLYGFGAYGEMIGGLLGMSGSASDYTFGEMLLSILTAYRRGFQWMLYMILCILPGIPFFMLYRGRYEKIRKIIYCICIVLLFFVLYKWGMFNFRYYQKESGLQWGVIFLLLSLGIDIWMLFTKQVDDEWMLIGSISLLQILITPLGSNNYVWPVLNNLFFIAPITLWMSFRFIKWGRESIDSTGRVPFFPVKAMLAGILIAFLIQSLGLGCFYVFLDGENGEKRIAGIENNTVLKGMVTTEKTAATLTSLTDYVRSREKDYEGKKLVLYGNIPGLSYYLDRAPAIYTTWADLDTNSYDRLVSDLEELDAAAAKGGAGRPLVIIGCGAQGGAKLTAVYDYMERNDYREAFTNAVYTIFE